MSPAFTISKSIAVAPAEVVRFVMDARNLPRWAPAFCKDVAPADGTVDGADVWLVQTTEGEVKLRFLVADGAHGVLDHVVTPAPQVDIYVPMRVVPNGDASEVLLTLFQPPAMTPLRLQQDLAMMESDLQRLKEVLEASA